MPDLPRNKTYKYDQDEINYLISQAVGNDKDAERLLAIITKFNREGRTLFAKVVPESLTRDLTLEIADKLTALRTAIRTVAKHSDVEQCTTKEAIKEADYQIYIATENGGNMEAGSVMICDPQMNWEPPRPQVTDGPKDMGPVGWDGYKWTPIYPGFLGLRVDKPFKGLVLYYKCK